MELKPEQLAENGYILLDSLGHKELVPFVRTYIKKWTRSSIIYMVSNVISVGMVLSWFWKNYGLENSSVGEGFTYLSYGFAIAFGLVPLHEYIHVLAYRSQGATKTSYGANLKKFHFMAIADGFVASRREFQIVALAPFVVISTTLLILSIFTGKLWTLSIFGVLLAHTAMSSGDFGLLSYFDYHKDKNIVTYDDKENGVSYFFGRDEQAPVNPRAL